jgi:prepilin-type processing-associated H-X9-DG protein
MEPKTAMKLRHGEHRGGFTFWELVVVVIVVFVVAGLLLPRLSSAKKGAQRINCVYNLKQIGTGTRLWAGDNKDRYPDQVPVAEGGVAPTDGTELKATETFRFFLVMSNDLNTPKILCCPEDAARPSGGAPGTLWPTNVSFQSDGPNAYFTNNLVVSYFVGCGAAEVHPRMFLSGDRNIYGPKTKPEANEGFGNSPTNGSGARVVFSSRPTHVGWTGWMHRNAGNVAFADGSVLQLTSGKLVQAFRDTGDTNTVPGANVILFP